MDETISIYLFFYLMNAINIKVKVSYKEKKFVIGTGY